MKGALDGLTGGRMTYRTLNEMTDRLAGALAKLGVKKGDRVMIFMPNSPQFVIAYFGILKAGGIVVATNPLYSAREMENQFNDCGAELILATSNFYKRVKEVQPKTKIKKVVVSHIREYMGGFLKTLFPLNKHSAAEHQADLVGGRCLDGRPDRAEHTRRPAQARHWPGRHCASFNTRAGRRASPKARWRCIATLWPIRSQSSRWLARHARWDRKLCWRRSRCSTCMGWWLR